MLLDIYSRGVVGWLIAAREPEDLAQELMRETCAKQSIPPGRLTIHADNGSAMVAKSMAQLLIDLDKGAPVPAQLPVVVWINPPTATGKSAASLH